jgi:hypothetical protein
MKIKTYSSVIAIPKFEDRYEYLRLGGKVGEDTFGHSRYLNQVFYKSREWKDFRDYIIIRDNGCDLAHPDRKIAGRIYIHHLNPISQKDILDRTDILLDPENAICVSFDTHQAIHYGDINLLRLDPVERKPNDTCPWR